MLEFTACYKDAERYFLLDGGVKSDDTEILPRALELAINDSSLIAIKWRTAHGRLRLYLVETKTTINDQRIIAQKWKEYFRLTYA